MALDLRSAGDQIFDSRPNCVCTMILG